MKKFFILIILTVVIFTSCKKDAVPSQSFSKAVDFAKALESISKPLYLSSLTNFFHLKK